MRGALKVPVDACDDPPAVLAARAHMVSHVARGTRAVRGQRLCCARTGMTRTQGLGAPRSDPNFVGALSMVQRSALSADIPQIFLYQPYYS